MTAAPKKAQASVLALVGEYLIDEGVGVLDVARIAKQLAEPIMACRTILVLLPPLTSIRCFGRRLGVELNVHMAQCGIDGVLDARCYRHVNNIASSLNQHQHLAK